MFNENKVTYSMKIPGNFEMLKTIYHAEAVIASRSLQEKKWKVEVSGPHTS